jgi:hypothetical protein
MGIDRPPWFLIANFINHNPLAFNRVSPYNDDPGGLVSVVFCFLWAWTALPHHGRHIDLEALTC